MKKEFAGILSILTFLTIFMGSPHAFSNLTSAQGVTSNGQIIYPDYTIWTQNGVYYANNTHNAISYSSTSASNVLNYVCTALAQGGFISIRDGTYAVNEWKITQPNLYIIGESWKTILTIPNGFNNDVINVVANNVTINNIQVDGNMANQNSMGNGVAHGIQVWGASNFTIENCYVTNCWSEAIVAQNGANYGIIRGCTVKETRISGITLYGKADSTTSTNTRWITVSDCTVLNTGLNGQLGDGVYFGGVDYCFAFNIFINTTSDAGLEIQGGVNQNSFSHGNEANNITILNTKTSGIYLDGVQSYPVYDASVMNFRISNTTGLYIANYVENPTISSGIVENTGGIGVHIYNHVFNGEYSTITINNTSADGAKIDGNDCMNNTLDKISFLNVATYGLEILPGNSNNTLQYSEVTFGNYGVHTESDYTSIRNNYFSGGTDSAIYFASNYNNILANSIIAPLTTSAWAICGVSSINSSLQSNKISTESGNGIEITGGASTNNLISNNYVNATKNAGTGILLYSSGGAMNNTVLGNTIVNNIRGINIKTTTINGTIVSNNQFISCTAPISDTGVDTIIANNTGYNPVGHIMYPFSGNNHILIDSGGNNATWTSAATYTNWESAKTLYISGGNIIAVVKNGQTILAKTGFTVVLQPGDTFSMTFSSIPDVTVEGQ